MRLIVAALTGIALSACSGGENLKSADLAVHQFHNQLNGGAFHEIYRGSSPALKAVSSEQDMVKLLTAVRSKLGSFKGGKRTSWRVNYGTNAGTIIVFDSAFDKGKAQETFTFANTKDSPLVGYNINSPTLITG